MAILQRHWIVYQYKFWTLAPYELAILMTNQKTILALLMFKFRFTNEKSDGSVFKVYIDFVSSVYFRLTT